jgi:hypothetical protein
VEIPPSLDDLKIAHSAHIPRESPKNSPKTPSGQKMGKRVEFMIFIDLKKYFSESGRYSRLNKPRRILPMAVAVTAKVFNLYPLGF